MSLVPDRLWDDYYVARHSKDSGRIAETRAAIEAEARQQGGIDVERLREAADAVYMGRLGFNYPNDPDILALGRALGRRAALAPEPVPDRYEENTEHHYPEAVLASDGPQP